MRLSALDAARRRTAVAASALSDLMESRAYKDYVLEKDQDEIRALEQILWHTHCELGVIADRVGARHYIQREIATGGTR